MYGIQSNGIMNLSNVIMSGYSQINSVRLAQALSGKSAGSTVSSARQGSVSSKNKLSAEDADFLKDYQKEMQELKAEAEKVLAGGDKSRLAAGALDASVAEVSGKLGDRGDQYKLTVEQLASGQINRSTVLNSKDPMPSMGGSLRIKTEKGSFDFYLSAAGTKTNREMLDKFASRINAKDTGVTASVKEKDGKAYLQLEGAAGDGSTFSVSGSLAERLGLDQVAQVGQQAVYTVQKNDGEMQRYTSDSNKVTLDGRLNAQLKGTGTTVIKEGAGLASRQADAVSRLVDKFNETISFLNRNSDRGVGVLLQVKRMITPPTSERSMNLAGITIRNDGSLRFDREEFMIKVQRSPDVINDVVESFANGIRKDAQMGMNERSGNLLNAVSYSQQSASGGQNAMNIMSLYNRSGVYNMTNYYAVGALMNINI